MNIARSYWQEVINDSERLIELSTGYIDANIYFRKGYAENALSRYDQAISSYTKGAEINSYDSWVFNSRGLSYLQKGDYTKAVQDFTTAIKKQTDGDSEKLGMYYNNRGVAFYRQNKKTEACSDYKKAAEFGNSNGISNYRNCK
jgi:tetratricopeptide (TPR) repeat protein